MKRIPGPATQAGFTLFEVMVAVLLVTIGIFGFAKMQALAVSSTQTASARSIVAVQANSLAAAMHGNRGFWSDGGLVPATFSTSGTTVTDPSGALTTVPSGNCEANLKPAAPACTTTQLAARDVKLWATSLTTLLPTATSAVNCSRSANVPVSCNLTITWTEHYVSSTGTAASDSRATGGDRTYTLYIEP
jgi:type IV pilus assembly protein PilV